MRFLKPATALAMRSISETIIDFVGLQHIVRMQKDILHRGTRYVFSEIRRILIVAQDSPCSLNKKEFHRCLTHADCAGVSSTLN